SSEALMAEHAAGAVPHEPGVPGGGGAPGHQGQQAGAPRLPGQLGDLQRRFGL
ncbi:AIM24 family protein, partial [Streptomyces umbrinus]